MPEVHLWVMSSTILASTPALSDVLHKRDLYFVKDVLLSFQIIWNRWDVRLQIHDIANAGKAGKVCARMTVEFREGAGESGDCFQSLVAFMEQHGGDFRKMFDAIASKPYPVSEYSRSCSEGSMTFYSSETQGVRTFSPFANYKPLTQAPAKWTVAHAIRALWNGQAANLRCNGRYTDDYAHDAAVSFREGPISDARAFAKGLIESPAGWWVSGDARSGEISVCCHHFDSNSFTLNLAGAQPAPALVAGS
jgi:hypothetical protein